MIIPIIPTQQYINDLRDDGGLSDGDIAKAVGLTRTTIWRLRTGKHHTTATEYGIRIANLHSLVFKQKRKANG